MKKVSLIIALVAIFCISCQKDTAPSFTPKIKSSNITGALALAQVQSMEGKSTGMESAKKILKFTSNNQLSDLIIYMENYEGKEMPCGVVANSIQDLSDDFVLLNNCIFVFPEGFYPEDRNVYGVEEVSLLLRKSDGAVYKMPSNNFEIMNHTDICSDNKGSIYFLNLSGCVMKLSTNGQDLTIQQITPSEFKYGSLAIDKNSNIAVSNGEHSGIDPNNRPTTRGGFHSFGHLYFASGGIKELALEGTSRGIFSFKGEFSSIEYGQNIKVKQLKIVGQDVSWEEVTSYLLPINSGISISDQDLAIVCNDKFINTIEVRDEVTGQKTMLLIYDGNTLVTKVEDKFPDYGYYNNKAYYAIDGFSNFFGSEPIGDGIIYKYDFQTLSASSITYDLTKIPAMISSKTEVLILDNTCKFLRYGYRSSDVKPIIVEINAETAEVSVTEYETNQSITTLVRLN